MYDIGCEGSAHDQIEGLEQFQDLCNGLEDPREDSMGLGSVVYWPDLEWPKEEK